MAEKKTREKKTKVSKKSLDNLTPFSEMDKDKLKKITSDGGKAAQKKIKKKKELKERFKVLMELPPNEEDVKKLHERLGVPEEEIDSNEMVMAISMFNQARMGNVKAFEVVNKVMYGESATDKEEIKIKKAELKMKQEKHALEMAEYNEKLNKPTEIYRGIPALSIAPSFLPVLFDINDHTYTEFVFPGGRGSTKSSFVSLVILDLMMKNEALNVLVMRNVGNTLKDSVFNQIKWAIDELDLNDEFKCTSNPVSVTRKKTGQRIFFRGADDPGKIKSIKPTKGYIGVIWFEELDQYAGPETVRNIEQSAMRGGDDVWVFKSFNPPKSAINWANKYILLPKENRIVVRSDYRTVPKKWLGKNWIDEAEFLKEVNPVAYENEYLGVANGTGGSVFDNVTVRTITLEERAEFDRIYEGVDWGWYPDPFHFSRMYYDAQHMRLFIYGEFRANKMSNEQTAKAVRDKFDKTYKVNGHEITESVEDGVIYCDSAEKKSTADWRTYGMPARNVEKGPDSVQYGMKWLQSLKEIIIDENDCPFTATEFKEYEYDRDKDGNVITGYPDRNNHSIDSVRYAMFPVWKRRGQ